MGSIVNKKFYFDFILNLTSLTSFSSPCLFSVSCCKTPNELFYSCLEVFLLLLPVGLLPGRLLQEAHLGQGFWRPLVAQHGQSHPSLCLADFLTVFSEMTLLGMALYFEMQDFR